MNFTIYISYYFLLLFSIIGYGFSFKFSFLKNSKNNLGYLGIYGIFFLIIISYFSNFFTKHDLIFNSLILVLGLSLFIFFLAKNYKLEKKNFFYLIFLFFILSVLIFAAKNHDDFPYYHFPYIHLLTNSNFSIGVGNFNHGFRTPSSIFYFSSLFYLPKIEYQLIHIAPIYFVGFINFIFLNKIYKNISQKKNIYIIFLSILSLSIINIFFYRLAEHGTDRSAQILIFLLVTEILQFINKGTENRNLVISRIMIITTLAISLKVFYFVYLLLFIVIFFYEKNFTNIFFELLKNKISYICISVILLLLLTNILNTGCFIYPMSFTCSNFGWAIPTEEVNQMNQWYQQWSKAGASPNFRVENPTQYIKNLNWLSNWIDTYFFNKVSDYLLGLFFLLLIITFLFKNKKNNKKINRKFILFYFILVLLFIEWFFYHPALRYGGYHIIALLLFIPYIFFIEKKFTFNKNNILKTKLFICLVFLIFLMRNVDRINKEYNVYNYNFLQYPSYNKEFKNFDIFKRIENIKKCKDNNNECKNDYIQVRKKFIFDIYERK